jgi:lysozyme
VKLGPNGTALIQHFEECRLVAYPDSKGVPTIAWGHTLGVKLGDTCTQQQADMWFAQDVGMASSEVNLLVHVPLTQNQFDALVSFVYNLGDENFHDSTLLTLLNQRQYQAAAAEFPKWDMCNRIPLAGLEARRLAEQALFLQA